MDEVTIFVTGVTGFLGGATVARLLESDNKCRFICLVRSSSQDEAKERVKQSLRRFLDERILKRSESHLDIILGDLLDCAWHGDRRLEKVTRVLHLAANTSFSQSPSIYKVNFEGALKVARAMKERQIQRFLYVGTGMICGDNSAKIVYEDEYPSETAQHIVPYTASKAKAESHLISFSDEISLVIARPSIVIGHTRLGCVPSGSIFWFFRAVDRLKKITWDMSSHIDIIPVDYAAKALSCLLLKPTLQHQRYHISAGREASVTWSEIAASFAQACGSSSDNSYQKISFAEITQEQMAELLKASKTKSMLKALELYYRFAALDLRFDNSRLLAEGVSLAPKFTTYLPLCQTTSESLGICEQKHASGE